MKNLIIIFLLLISINVYGEGLTKTAESAILIEASTGKVLYEHNADTKLAPASMTKMMTLLLTMENIDNGVLKMNDKVVVSKNASSMGGSQVYLEENSEYKISDMIKAVSIASGNDAAVVLAEAIGGNVSNFVKMMNERAKELGLDNTNFVNPYGLDDKDHYSSARDMAAIARELLKHDTILKYTSVYEDHLKKNDGTSIWMVNTNKLVRFYNGVDGLKTGFTDNAGYCMTATGMWNDLRLIAVVMREPTSDDRNKDVISMLNYGKSNYRFKKVLNRNKSIGKIKINLGKKEVEKVYLKDDVSYLYKANEKVPKFSYKIKLNKVKAPLKKDSVVGIANIYSNGKKYTKEDIVIKYDVDKCSGVKTFLRMLKIIITGVV